MSDPPLTLSVLAAFHRDVILPDMQRVVREIVDASVSAAESRLMGHIDGLAHKLVKFEEETEVGLARIEARLAEVEQRPAAS